jgi:uncharacterized protein YqgC (DUF456 family)
VSLEGLKLLVGAVMVIGVIGTVLPAVPDLVMMWGAGLVYGLVGGWGTGGPWLFGLMTVAAVGGLLAEVWVSTAGARLTGASVGSILAGLALGFIGLVFFSVFGAIVGLLMGAFLGEFLRWRDARQAVRSAAGIALGCGASVGVKLALGIIMAVTWGIWAIVG